MQTGDRYMNNANCSFEEWHDLLMQVAADHGGNAADTDAWRNDYYAGKHHLKRGLMNGVRINQRKEKFNSQGWTRKRN